MQVNTKPLTFQFYWPLQINQWLLMILIVRWKITDLEVTYADHVHQNGLLLLYCVHTSLKRNLIWPTASQFLLSTPCWVLALLSLSICTLSLLLSVRIVHNVHNLCNVHAVYYCRLYMDSLTQEWRIISTFQFLNFLCRFRFALSKHFW